MPNLLSFDSRRSNSATLLPSHLLAPLAPLALSVVEGSLDEGSEAVVDPEPGRREGPLATAPITPLECALTSHFAPKFDLKSFRMHTYVTPGEGGAVSQLHVNSQILNDLLTCHLVPVPRRCSLNNRPLPRCLSASHQSKSFLLLSPATVEGHRFEGRLTRLTGER